MFGRNELYGYGFAHIPTVAGTHDVEVSCWRPVGSKLDQIWGYFLNATPQLRNLDIIQTANDRYQLITESTGKVMIQVAVVTRNFHNHGVKL